MIRIFKEDGIISEIMFSDRSSFADKKTIRIKAKEFVDRYHLKILSNNLVVEENEYSTILKTLRQHIVDQNLKEEGITSRELIAHTIKFSSKIQLLNIDQNIGIAALANHDIQQGEYLLYAGELRFVNTDTEKTNPYIMPVLDMGEEIIAVDGLQFRNLAAYVTHMPDENWLKMNISFFDNSLQAKVASANLIPSIKFVKDLNILVPTLMATRDIQAGEILGFDYGSNYWHEFQRTPNLFEKNGSIIDPNLYKEEEFLLTIINPKTLKNKKDNGFSLWHNWKHFAASYARTKDQKKSNLYIDSKKLNCAILDHNMLQKIMESKGKREVVVEASIFADHTQVENLINLLTEAIQKNHPIFKSYPAEFLWSIDLSRDPSVTLNVLLDKTMKLSIEKLMAELKLTGIQFTSTQIDETTKYSLFINQLDLVYMAATFPNKGTI